MASIDAEQLYCAMRDSLRATLEDEIRLGTTALAGIYRGGAWIAERLAQDLDVALFGVVNIALHRDDYAKKGLHSQAQPTSLPFSVHGMHIVLVDDVLFTGRTMRAAINELYDYGRPACVELAVLIDRGCREMPIAASFVGTKMLNVPATEILVLQRDSCGALVFVTEEQV
ncbi:bifunctional pyr operon transcriptional regulator/uracil phosphoribosyltransferase PyrR [Candidatus Vallotia cooleyia]|uniref:bifunctional pyr operon transcriptional regulator/uracil phosphoribosyltransferase PyrR n=1 Tax=Candidatus Vallotiella adelgis TaxID=1177211 RepID=UPI001D02BD7B|nr:bifunctional pyr operon transcriptional regulator/uracil phosphoribosyltransferase PyrR [Candidatus Vallotia cooleyia]